MTETAPQFSKSEHLDGKVTLYGGDNRDVLKSLPDNSIDSIVTDPPYALVSIQKRFGKPGSAPVKVDDAAASNDLKAAYARASSGFMGKQWDTGEVAFSEVFWAECLRVLKPGGHVVAFSGTRTYHRMAVAIEDAGFEIRDQLAWMYGCLDDQTMAVTPSGVIPYHKIKKGDLVLAYDPSYMSYQWERVEEVFAYDIDDTVYRIATDYGDQVVSRNHRCIVERDGAEVFEFAEKAAREREIRVPALEDLRELLEALSGAHERAGIAQPDMLSGVQERIDSGGGLSVGVEEDAVRSCGEVGSVLRGVRGDILEKHEASGEGDNSGLLSRVQRRSAWGGMEQTRLVGASELETGIGGGASREDDRANQSCVEGWRHISEPEGQLRERSLREVSGSVSADVAEGRLRNGASPECCEGNRSPADASGVRTSYRPQSTEQRTDEPNAIRNEQGPQTVRAWRGHKAVVGRITPERYSGVIWCVRVKSGAFVAVRDGFAFPTGNSGFPKSHDVSKAIDKAAGAERAKVRHKPRAETSGTMSGSSDTRPWIEESRAKGYHEVDGPEPATDAAREWQGWGTALKPAWEPICLARKPLAVPVDDIRDADAPPIRMRSATVAENVLEHGTGALNIDGCRVGTEGGTRKEKSDDKSETDSVDGYLNAKAGEPIDAGRWPANIVHDGSDEVLSAFPDAPGQQRAVGPEHGEKESRGIYGDFGAREQFAPRVDTTKSAARFFYAAKASRKDRDEGLEHLPKRAGGMVSNTSGQHITRRDEGYKPAPRANTHPTVKPTDLMRWLCRLVTPPGGVILDPFMGSGSTGKAALLEGFRFIGCEREDEYMPIAEARIAAALRPVAAVAQPAAHAPAAQANDNAQRSLFDAA